MRVSAEFDTLSVCVDLATSLLRCLEKENKFDNRDYQPLATNVINKITIAMNQPTQTSVHELMRQMIEQYCMRDEQVISILSQLSQKLVTTSVPTTILPDLTKTISIFDGKQGDTELASEWLYAVRTTTNLKRWINRIH